MRVECGVVVAKTEPKKSSREIVFVVFFVSVTADVVVVVGAVVFG